MPETIASLTQGLPVEIGKIDRALKQLWSDDDAATRASLMNLAVYCEGGEMMEQTTQAISEITRDHACRSILIGLDPTKSGLPVQATIQAHCHLSRAGAKQVCCEQITFQLGADGLPLIPNIVFSHLDSDLPLVLWWRAEFPQESEEQLWTWVDRLIFDSQTWQHMGTQWDLLQKNIEPASHRMTLCDLNWTRSLYMRQAVAQIFDHPEFLGALHEVCEAEIIHAPGMRSTALILAGWLSSQLKWTFIGVYGPKLSFRCPANKQAAITLTEKPGPALSGITIGCGANSFEIMHQEGSNFLHADIHLPEIPSVHYLMPEGKEDIVSLLDDELMSGGKHQVYLKAIAAISKAF
jgi:glucose-6-phosphate dehydrogenase assembly protein OpcA